MASWRTYGGALQKVFRFVKIYGFGKTLFKIFGRIRPAWFSARGRRERDIGLIGCGQFAFATIGYSVWRKYGNRFIACYDIDPTNQKSFASYYGLSPHLDSAREVLQDDRVKVVYIASNHASHSGYAVDALQAGKVAYIEKPISVSMQQLKSLVGVVETTGGRVCAGYNRPFSGAVRRLRSEMSDMRGPLTLSCFVSGHVLEGSHWYRRPEEGTRICGNVGHWLDLAVHLLSWDELPDLWRISLSCSDELARDDDVAISLTSERGDLVNIVLTARSEPFEGINETINIQCGSVIAKIDDFRRMTVWNKSRLRRYSYWPKDVGHNLAIMQPFSGTGREWGEVVKSTVLMLFIMDMVVEGRKCGEFSFMEALARLR